jgi:hypothetical protein
MIIEGTVFKVGTPLRNGMVINEDAIDKFLCNIKDSGEGCIFGQLDHPENEMQPVPMHKIAEKIDVGNFWKDSEGNLMAKVEILDTPEGEVLSQIANRIGKDLKLSPAGTIYPDGNFELMSVNVVYE